MPKIIITQDQLESISENLRNEKLSQSIDEKWKKFSMEEKLFVLEFLKVTHPDKKKQLESVIKKTKSNLLNEKWYNTVMDIVGWVDPTGIVDAVNGVSYLSQGEYLFGFLSIVAAVPYVGDVVAKPVMHALKLGKPSAKALNKIMAMSKAGKTAEASAELAKLASSGGIVGTFVKGIGKLGSKLESLIKAMPGGVLKGFKNTLLEWIRLFKNAGKSAISTKNVIGNLARKFPRLSQADQLKNLENLKTALAAEKGMFTGYRTANKLFSWKTFWGGMPQLMGRNRSVRALMRKSKWYLGLLDFLGIGNFVGPEELQAQMGDAKFEEKISEYNNTAEAQQNFKDEFGSESQAQDFLNRTDGAQTQTTTSSASSQQPKTGMDPLTWLLSNSFSKI